MTIKTFFVLLFHRNRQVKQNHEMSPTQASLITNHACQHHHNSLPNVHHTPQQLSCLHWRHYHSAATAALWTGPSLFPAAPWLFTSVIMPDQSPTPSVPRGTAATWLITASHVCMSRLQDLLQKDLDDEHAQLMLLCLIT
jgi:hypothetical protein